MPDLPDQYRIVTTSAGWFDKTARGRLRLDGRDAASFLHALLTNDVESLSKGRGVYALYLTPQGRVITDLRVHHRGDHLIVDVPPGLAAPLSTRLDQVIFSEDVRLSDVSGKLAEIAVLGPRGAEFLAPLVDVRASDLAALPTWSHVDIANGFVARSDDTALASFDVFAPPPRLAELTRSLGDAGVPAMPPGVFDMLRIEAGRPAFGPDVSEETIPLEAGLVDRAISLTKGCYVGQEVIVRVLHRGGGRVARLLVRLDFDGAVTDAPAAGTAISSEGREIGRVTSSAWSPGARRAIALAYVRRELAEPGRQVDAAGASATIVSVVG
jgi:folate-binding protein YgfZ